MEVSFKGGRWLVVCDGELVNVFRTRAEAVELGRATARSYKPAELVIRYRHGRVFRVHAYPPLRSKGVSRREQKEMWRRLKSGQAI